MSPTVTILLVGSAVAVSCSLLGSFLVLRRMALLGDAISHSVLPGIVLAFLFTGSRAALPMVAGAAALGVLTVFLVERLHRTGRLYEDASIGVVFPALFSVGVILISRYASMVDLDLDCVLYGEIAYAPWDLLVLGDRSWGPRGLWINGTILLLNGALVAATYKELKLTSFDPALAASLGISPVRVHYVLMSAVSVTVVGAFESVGAILVVAMLVVPAAAAYLLVESLAALLAVAAGLGVAATVLGHGLATSWDASIAGGMATAAGALFLAAFLLSPHHGLVAGLLRRRRLARDLAGHLVLLHLRDGHGESSPEALRRRFGWTAPRLERRLATLAGRGFVAPAGGGWTLTQAGRRELDRVGAPAGSAEL